MNKREWRKCYKDLLNEIDQVRRECAEQLEKAERGRDYYKTLCQEKQAAVEKVADQRDALLAWQRRAREAWDFSTWLHANSTVLGLAILSEPKVEP